MCHRQEEKQRYAVMVAEVIEKAVIEQMKEEGYEM